MNQYGLCVGFLIYGVGLGDLLHFSNRLAKRKWFNCLVAVFSVSSLRCHRLVCNLRLWHRLAIFTCLYLQARCSILSGEVTEVGC